MFIQIVHFGVIYAFQSTLIVGLNGKKIFFVKKEKNRMLVKHKKYGIGEGELFKDGGLDLIKVNFPFATKIFTQKALDNGVLEFGSMSIEPFRTSHDAPGARGYIIREGNKSCVYVTDTGYVNYKNIKYLI